VKTTSCYACSSYANRDISKRWKRWTKYCKNISQRTTKNRQI